jgi:hypothetical protein
MPPRVTDPYACFEHIGLCWAGQESGALEWDLRSAASRPLTRIEPLRYSYADLTETSEGDRTGLGAPCFLRSKRGEGNARHCGRGHHLGTFSILEHPPQRQVHKKLEPHTGQAMAGASGSRLHFEWIAPGLTVVGFWTAPRRWIAALEGPVGFRAEGKELHTGPIESE